MIPHPARLRHLPHLWDILRAATRAAAALPAGDNPLADLWALARVTALGKVRFLADDAGPAGFLIRDGRAVHALYVHPRAQGRGIGRALLAEAQATAGALDLWVLEQNRHARRFYTRAGFAEKARGRGAGNDADLPDILMVWPPERRAEP